MSQRKQIPALLLDTQNANKGTDRGQALLRASLEEVGAGRSILADKHGRVIAGNKTYRAWQALGTETEVVHTDGSTLVVVQRDDLDLDEPHGLARKLAYYDNRVNELDLDWDVTQILADVDAGMDLSGLWETDELEALLVETQSPLGNGSEAEPPEPQIDKAEELREHWGVELGQVWELGQHRVVCGDCTQEGIRKKLLSDITRYACVTDPPYGVGVNYNNFEDDPAVIKKLLEAMWPLIHEADCAALTPGVPLLQDYPSPTWIGAWVHPAPSGSCPWGFAGTNPILFYGPDPYLKQGKGRRPESIIMATNREKIEGHPTPKPQKVWDWLVERLTPDAQEVVVDPFLGSGTTLIACERLNRQCRGIEIDPGYVAVTLQRWADMTGGTPTLVNN